MYECCNISNIIKVFSNMRIICLHRYCQQEAISVARMGKVDGNIYEGSPNVALVMIIGLKTF